ncbi:MAG: hypothetical protein GY749_32700 [Desulfobacteraceae bacterium]|nr:hypothetical protein [Desulfobacteraceae bacterium]
MNLKYKYFAIPIQAGDKEEAEFNRFLESVEVIAIHREFATHRDNSYWCMAVEYISDQSIQRVRTKKTAGSKIRVDYREVLSPDDFAIYAKVRDWRKLVAEKEATPIYTIFTNEQMAKIAEKRVSTKQELQEIEGIGEARTQKYGEAVIKIVAQAAKSGDEKTKNETKEQSLLFDTEPGKS